MKKNIILSILLLDVVTVFAQSAYVDLGLSVKWATCNLGTSSPTEAGNFYAWGETQPKSDYSWRTYKYCDGTVIPREYESDSTTILKYNVTDGKRELDAGDDAATASLGGNWRMPTVDEMYELCKYCYWQPSTQDGVQGYNIFGPNGNSIFLPAKGYYWTSTIFDSLSINYTRSSDDADSHLKAIAADYDLDDYGDMHARERCIGSLIRPVWAEPEEQPSGSIPVAILSTNTDDETKTLTFTFADASMATAQNGEDGTYRLNVKKRTPGWNPKNSYPSISKVVFTPAFANARPTSTHSWFEDFPLETIDGIEYLNTSEVTDMSYMFRFCPSLTTIDVTHFDTRNVTDMAAMFEQCHALQSVDLSGFNTEKVTSMHDMFDYCGNLHYVDVSHFNTSNVVDFGNMFNDSAIDSIDVSSFDTRKAKFLYSMFSDCEMDSLDLSVFSFESAIDASELLNPCNNLTYLNMGSNDLKGMSFEYYDEGMKFNGEPFDGVGTEDNPCTLVINSDFDKSVLGEQYNNGKENYFKWHDGYFKVKEVPTGIGTIRQNGSNNVITYRLDGTLVNGKPTKAGVYILDNGGKRTKIMMKP